MIKALVVDDSALMRKTITAMLVEAGGFSVQTARNGEDALAAIPRVQPDVVTLDLNMPVMDGLTCLAAIMRDFALPVVIVSSLSERAALVTVEALQLGAVDFVIKPGGALARRLPEAAGELVAKVRRAAGLRPRPDGPLSRLRRRREELQLDRPRSSPAVVRTPPSAVSRSAVSPSVVSPPAVSRSGGSPPAVSRSSGSRSSGAETSTPGADLVLIGSSTGGPAVLPIILSRLPVSFPAAVVVAQHMPASFTGVLARRLDDQCPLPVCEVTATMPVKAGHIYIARGDSDILLCRRSGVVAARPVPASGEYRWHPSVDRMVASAGEVVSPSRIIAVLLTGMGNDGAETMTLLCNGGGRTIAESEVSAVVWGMPGQLVARAGATLVLDAGEVAAQLLAWA